MIDSSVYVNKADFQRHFNGCERRFEQYSRSIEFLSKINPNSFDQHQNELKNISREENELSTMIIALDRSPFVSSVDKRFDRLKMNFIKHQQIFKDLRSNFNVETIELDFLNETNRKIERVEEDLLTLHGTFNDLHRIVHEQGSTIENIEAAMSTTDRMVEEGKQEIQTTIEVTKKTKKTRLILVILLSTVVFLLFLIVLVALKLSILSRPF